MKFLKIHNFQIIMPVLFQHHHARTVKGQIFENMKEMVSEHGKPDTFDMISSRFCDKKLFQSLNVMAIFKHVFFSAHETKRRLSDLGDHIRDACSEIRHKHLIHDQQQHHSKADYGFPYSSCRTSLASLSQQQNILSLFNSGNKFVLLHSLIHNHPAHYVDYSKVINGFLFNLEFLHPGRNRFLEIFFEKNFLDGKPNEDAANVKR